MLDSESRRTLSVWGGAEGQRTFLKISISSHQNIDGV